MIKLITPKRDLYMDGDTSNPEGLFGKKGKFYEVKGYGYAGEDIMFVDERSVEHSYGLDCVDEDFWTVDFDKGFEFERYGNSYEFKDGVVMHVGSVVDDVPVPRVIYLIANGLWHITRFSDQTVPSATPEETPHPYENWKKDIGIAKFKRCIDKVNLLHYRVEGIKGLLDRKNELFYYSVHSPAGASYISCKVIRDEDNYEWKFPRQNKDTLMTSTIVTERYKPWCDYETRRIETQNEDIDHIGEILASFKLPKDKCIADKLAEELASAYKNTFESSVTGGEEVLEEKGNTWTDKHYDFTYTLAPEDIEAGEIKIDPYFVNRMWNINSWDDTGAAFHSLKNYARICNNKNPLERDLKSLYKQVKRLCELHGVKL